MHQLSAKAATELRALGVADDWSYPASDGELRIVLAPLPGRAVIGAARSGDLLWIVIDVDKPSAREHLMKLVEQWPFGKVRGCVVGPPLSMADLLALLTPFDLDQLDPETGTAVHHFDPGTASPMPRLRSHLSPAGGAVQER